MKLLATEKAVMMIKSQNVLTFRTNMNKTKKEIREEIESLFDIKIEKIRTLIRGNKNNFIAFITYIFKILKINTWERIFYVFK